MKSLCAMNRLSERTYVRTDGRTDGRKKNLVAIDQSYIRQPMFGSQDVAIRAGSKNIFLDISHILKPWWKETLWYRILKFIFQPYYFMDASFAKYLPLTNTC